MEGKKIREAVQQDGRTLTELAAFLGVSLQNLNGILNKENIKTETLEGAARFLGRPISFFYNEGNTATASGSGTAVAGVGNSVNDSLLIDEIAAQRRLTEQALAQNGQLLKIIDNLTRK